MTGKALGSEELGEQPGKKMSKRSRPTEGVNRLLLASDAALPLAMIPQLAEAKVAGEKTLEAEVSEKTWGVKALQRKDLD